MKAVTAIIAALLITGGITYAVPIVCETNGVKIVPWPFTFATLFTVVAAVFFLLRYTMTNFVYEIRPRTDIDSGGLETAYAGELNISRLNPEMLDFAVYKSQGAKPGILECLMGLNDLVKVIPLKDGTTKKTVRDQYAKDGFTFFDYTLTLSCPDALELIFIDGNKYTGIIIEPDEAMREYLLNYKG